MQHRLDPVGENLAHDRVVGDAGDDQPRLRGYGIAVAGAQVVDDDDVVAALDQPSRDDASDVTGSAGDQELHAGAFSWVGAYALGRLPWFALLFARARRLRAFFAMPPVSQMTGRTQLWMSGHFMPRAGQRGDARGSRRSES